MPCYVSHLQLIGIWFVGKLSVFQPCSSEHSHTYHVSVLCAGFGTGMSVAQACLYPVDCSLPGFSVHGDSPGMNTGVGFHAFLQGIFPTQGSNPDLPHCRRILMHLSHQGNPRILEWVAYSFCRGSSLPRNGIRVSCISGRFFTK